MTTKLRVLISSVILAISVGLSAQQLVADKSVTVKFEMECYTDISSVLNELYKDHGERLVFHTDVDEDDKSQIAMFYNKRTGSYTITKLMSIEKEEGVSEFAICILGSGRTKLDWKVLAERFA